LTAAREADGWREQQREVLRRCLQGVTGRTATARGSSEAQRMLEGDDRRRMTRAGAERIGARKRVPVSVSATTTGKGPLARVGHLGDSATRHRPASSSSIEAPMSPLSLPQSPILCLTPRSISSRFPLRRKSGAHRLEIGPLLLIYLFSEGTYVSTYDVSPHYGPPSAISAHSRPPLLASGAHSIGFRRVVCCLCIDLT
jgi:hypothetical protein